MILPTLVFPAHSDSLMKHYFFVRGTLDKQEVHKWQKPQLNGLSRWRRKKIYNLDNCSSIFIHLKLGADGVDLSSMQKNLRIFMLCLPWISLPVMCQFPSVRFDHRDRTIACTQCCFGLLFPHLNMQKTCWLWAPTTGAGKTTYTFSVTLR